MSAFSSQKPPNYFRVAWQSALAAALCLGLPAGLVFWLFLLQRLNHSAVIKSLVDFLHANGLYSIYLLVVSSILWSYLLGRISGYRSWWWIALASALGILVTWFSPLSNIDGILYEYQPALPIHLNYVASMVGLIGTVTLLVGLGYGLILRSLKAALTLGLTTSFISVSILILTIFVFDLLGIRVGTGNLAMVKVTVVVLVTCALAGGMVLGVGFTQFVEQGNRNGITSVS